MESSGKPKKYFFKQFSFEILKEISSIRGLQP